MTATDFANESRLGAHHIGDGLTGLGLGPEGHEIDRVTTAQGDADLAVGLEAANAGAVAGARVDDHVGPFPVQNLDTLRRNDFEQHVIDRRREIAPVHHRLVVVNEHRRRARRFMRDVVIAALAQNIERQDGAFDGVTGVFFRVMREFALLGGFLHLGQQRLEPRDGASQPFPMTGGNLLHMHGGNGPHIADLGGKGRAIFYEAAQGALGAVRSGHG